MKRYNKIILLCFFFNARPAIRDPFESLVNHEIRVEECSENSLSSAPTTTWQIAHTDESGLILKNSDGEIRRVELPQ